jgi:V/A-type H+-transporting ATPase subunit K
MTTAIILAYVGVALMIGVCGLASSVGTGICGMATVGAMKKNPNKFGSYMIMSVMPSTQGLYGFAAYYLMSGFIKPEMTIFAGSAVFGAGLALAIAAVASAYLQAKICANGIAATAGGHNVVAKTMILAAFPEIYAILGLAVVFLIRVALNGAGL